MGSPVELAEDNAVGISVGPDDGTYVGYVGNDEGCGVGLFVGALIGRCVGSAVPGDTLGLFVGVVVELGIGSPKDKIS